MRLTVSIVLFLLWPGVAATLPVIDIAPLLEPDPGLAAGRLNCTQAIVQALQASGIFLIVGHGLDTDNVHFRASENLFGLEEDAKLEVSMGKDYMRGYIPYGAESGLRQSVVEPKEGFAYGHPSVNDKDEDLNYLAYPNTWPRGFAAEDRLTLEAMYSRKVEISKVIVRAVASEVVGDMDVESMLEGGELISLERMFHYFPVSGIEGKMSGIASDKTILGSSPHRDWGLLTLILQDDVGGLEYLDLSSPQGTWRGVPSVPSTLVVNGGDFLALLTDNKCQSPIHQVRAPATKERLSFVFFFYPAYGTPVPRRRADLIEQEVKMQFNSFSGSTETLFGDAMVNKWKGVQTLTHSRSIEEVSSSLL